jgi:DNA-binding transcriptional LysR family regulator
MEFASRQRCGVTLLLAGLGIALTPDFVVADLVRSGALQVLLSSFEPPPMVVHGVRAQHRYLPRKVRPRSGL